MIIAVIGLLPSPSAEADPLSSYAGLQPLSGDVHRHAGSTQDHVDLINLGTNGNCGATGLLHETGEAPAVYSHLKARGYDWANIAFHINLPGAPNKFDLIDDPNDAAYLAWTDPSLPERTDAVYSYGYTLDPSPNGLPDYQTGGFVSPPYNEAKSLSSAAALLSVPGSFAAFAGREWTQPLSKPYPGHSVAILPNSTETCSPSPTEPTCASGNESDLYRFVHRMGGVLIKAHPKQITGASPSTKFFGPWEPRADSCHLAPTGCTETNAPSSGACGFSDRAYQGIEVGYADSSNGAGNWELGYRVGVAQGYRLFPAFGSDRHKLHSGIQGCQGDAEATVAHGATMCWGPSGSGWTRDDIVSAMKARRCYYSSSNEPVLQMEACTESTCTGPKRIMGERLDVSGGFRVRVYAKNDPSSVAPRRMSRLELVAVSGPLDGDTTVLAHDSCDPDSSTDSCDIDATISLAAGAIYARACGLGEGETSCLEGKPEDAGVVVRRTVAIGAPIFVNWDAYHSLVKGSPATSCDLRWEAPGSADWEEDFVYDECDNCLTVPNLAQTNADGDALGDLCDGDNDNDGFGDMVDYRPFEFDEFADGDNDGLFDPFDSCPTVSNPYSEDADGDSVGDACDNCTSKPNPRVAFNYTCGTVSPWATLTGRQRDDDQDGYGNQCDAKFTPPPPEAVTTADAQELFASIPVDSPGEPIGGDTCGVSNNKPCSIFDLDGDGGLGSGDIGVYFLQLDGQPPGPRCPTCPLQCTAGTSGYCAP